MTNTAPETSPQEIPWFAFCERQDAEWGECPDVAAVLIGGTAVCEYHLTDDERQGR